MSVFPYKTIKQYTYNIFRVAVVSHLRERRAYKRGWIRAVDGSDPELWKNKALFSCWERSLQDSVRASHNRAQLLDLTWEWMERTRARAKPQRQTPNLANKRQPRECQLGTQMDVFFFSSPSTADRPSAHRAALQLLCCGVCIYVVVLCFSYRNATNLDEKYKWYYEECLLSAQRKVEERHCCVVVFNQVSAKLQVVIWEWICLPRNETRTRTEQLRSF